MYIFSLYIGLIMSYPAGADLGIYDIGANRPTVLGPQSSFPNVWRYFDYFISEWMYDHAQLGWLQLA